MAKCIRCGGSFLTRRRVKLKDAEICGKCYKELGFDNYLVSGSYTYEEIKDGYDAYRVNQRKKEIKDAVIGSVSVNIAGAEKDLICTEEERMVFEEIKKMLGTDELELIRKSNDYVTAAVGDWDLVRIKYTNRAKWVTFPLLSNEKIRMESPEDVQEMASYISDSVAVYNKYADVPLELHSAE